MGCLWLIAALIGSALIMHVFTYLNETNGENLCTSDIDQFGTQFLWAEAGSYFYHILHIFWLYFTQFQIGVAAGSMIVILTCCVICCSAMVAAAEESDKQQQGGHNNNSNVRTVANYNNNNNNYNSRARLLGGRQQQRQPQMTAEQQRYVGGLLSLAVVEECGFCIATENNRRIVLNKLQSVNPLGQTALRDAVIYGIQKMLALKVVIAKLGVIQHKLCNKINDIMILIKIEISVK